MSELSPEITTLLREQDTVAVVTERASGERAATPIWSVVVNGEAYIRSVYGAKAAWFVQATSGREFAIAIGDGHLAERDRPAALELPRQRVLVEAVPADDPRQAGIDAEFRRKYAADPTNVGHITGEAAVGCTLRVLPV